MTRSASTSPAPARVLGRVALLCLGLNGIVGVGIFFAPSEVAAALPGARGLLAYVGTALLLAPVAAVYARLGSRFDEDGGPYIWARAAFGRGASFGVGWMAYVSAVFSSAAVVAGLSGHLASWLGLSGAGARVLGIALVGVLGALVATGLKPSARIWTALTLLKLFPLLLLVAAFAALGPSVIAETPVPASEAGDWLRAMLIVVFTLQGFEIVPVVARRASHSRHSVPWSTAGALLLSACLYVLLHAACVAALPNLASSSAPLVDAAAALGGARLASVVGAGATVSALGIAFGMFAITPRYLCVLGSSDAFGPRWARESDRGVPGPALGVTLCAIAVLVGLGELGELFALSSIAVMVQYAASAAALGKLSWQHYQGFSRADLVAVVLVAFAIAFLVPAATPREVGIAVGVLGVGFLLYRLPRGRSTGLPS